jgi:hypothetical protein
LKKVVFWSFLWLLVDVFFDGLDGWSMFFWMDGGWTHLVPRWTIHLDSTAHISISEKALIAIKLL